MNFKTLIAPAVVAGLLAGCTMSTPVARSAQHCALPTPVWQSWAESNGGILLDSHQDRAQRVCHEVTDHLINQPVTIHVLNNSSLTAYSWPSGDIFVSAGLMDDLTDQELAAAIAHELGHLLNDGQVQSIRALRGAGNAQDIEVRADAWGSQVLQVHQIPLSAMISMLQKVQAAQLPGVCRDNLGKRIAVLEASAANR